MLSAELLGKATFKIFSFFNTHVPTHSTALYFFGELNKKKAQHDASYISLKLFLLVNNILVQFDCEKDTFVVQLGKCFSLFEVVDVGRKREGILYGKEMESFKIENVKNVRRL